MKISCLFIVLGCSGLQMLMAGPGNAQGLNDVKVNLELNHEPLKAAFTKIEKQTDYRFAYNKREVDSYNSLSLARDNYSIQQVLELLLVNTDLSFRLIRNKIIIFRKEPEQKAAEPLSAAFAQQDGTIKGKVTNEQGEPVAAASIVLVGLANKGTAANNLGEFTLSGIKPGTYTIRISGVGFEVLTQQVTVTDNQVQELNFQLHATTSSMDQVVVTGYSRQSKRDVTGAASTVSAEAIAQTPVTDITTALQGRVAGVSVDDQGGPGNSGVIRIRGIGSLGNNDPLYVIDGVQIRIGGGGAGSQDIANLLNPNNIESVTILKDPSLTALYGSEGSNGVIVITTKSGRKGDPQLQYDAYVGSQMPKKFPDMITPQQQADALFKSYANSGQNFPYGSFYGNGSSPVLPDYIIEGPTPNQGVAANDPAADPSLYNFNNYRILQANKSGTDWWKTLFKPAFIQNHQLSISGATDKNNYAVTFGYLDDNGTMLESYFKRLSLRVNTDFKVKPWLRVGENMEVSYTTNNTISTSNLANNQNNFNNSITELYALSPLLPTHDIAGNIAGTNGASVILGGSNPLIERTASTNSKSYTEAIIGSAYIEVEPIKNLTFQSRIGVQFVPNQYHSFSDSFPQQPIPSHTTYYYEGGSYYTDWRWTNKLAYSYTLNGIHKFSAFVAYEARELKSRYNEIIMTNLISNAPNFQYVQDGVLDPNFPPQGLGSVQTSLSTFGNLTYSLMDR
ncbi:MAG TPA: SusC/RagA family TonB-linked outer membrane protein, partial [Puia sp.]|nr:SusC/RagA family TonB-linked outer membrane protein [Puia sp.]